MNGTPDIEQNQYRGFIMAKFSSLSVPKEIRQPNNYGMILIQKSSKNVDGDHFRAKKLGIRVLQNTEFSPPVGNIMI